MNLPHAYSKAVDHVTISIGVACVLSKDNDDPASLNSLADEAHYAAKEQGCNRDYCTESSENTAELGA